MKPLNLTAPYQVSRAAFRDAQRFNDAIAEAMRRAGSSGVLQRVYKAYGQYHIRPFDAPYDGRHVAGPVSA